MYFLTLGDRKFLVLQEYRQDDIGYRGNAVPVPALTTSARSGEDSALFADLLASAENPVLVLDTSLSVRHANGAARRLFQPEVNRATSLSLTEFSGPGCLYFCELVAAAVHRGESLTGKDVTIGGDAFSMSVHRGAASWIVSLRPVTRELSLEYQAKLFRQHRDILLEAMDGIEGSVVIVDTVGRIRYMNRFTRKYVGDLMHGVDMAEWPKAAGFYREDGVTLLDGPRRIFPRALKGQTVIDEAMVIRNEITGDAVRVQASATPVHDEKNRIVSAIGWFHYVGPFNAQLTALKAVEQDDGNE